MLVWGYRSQCWDAGQGARVPGEIVFLPQGPWEWHYFGEFPMGNSWLFKPRNPVAQMVKNLPAMQETWVRSLGQEDPLEKGMAIHSSILAWWIPWTDKLAGYSPWGCKQSDTTEDWHYQVHWPEGRPVHTHPAGRPREVVWLSPSAKKKKEKANHTVFVSLGCCEKLPPGTFLVIQWLRLCASNRGGLGFDSWSGN